MSEVKDISSIDGGAFPSLEVLQRYLRGEASADERAQIEAMLEDDPMMADAIEGLEMIEDPAVLQRSIQKITNHSRQHLKRHINKREALIRRQSRISPKNLLPYIGTAAAAIALLITTVFVIRQMAPNPQMASDNTAKAAPKMDAEVRAETDNEAQLESVVLSAEQEENIDSQRFNANQPIAQATSPLERSGDYVESTPVEVIESPSPVEPQTSSLISAGRDDFEPTPPQPSSNQPSTIPQVSATSGQAEQESHRDDGLAVNDSLTSEKIETKEVEYFDENELESIPVYENEDRYGNTAPVLEETSTRAKAPKQTSLSEPLIESAPRRSLEDIQQGKLERAAAITDMIAKAVRHLEAKEYDKAIIQLDEVLLTEPENVVAHHYRAKAYLAKGNDEAAQTSLETILTIGSGDNFEADQWALANVYKRLGKKFKLKSLLKEIVKAGGTYAKQAEVLLAE